MLLLPFNSSINVFMKKYASLQLLSVSPLLWAFLKLPFLTKTRPDHLFLSLSWFRKENNQTVLMHPPLQAAQCQVNPTAYIFSFCRLPNVLFAGKRTSDFVVIFMCIFSLILLYGFPMFSSIFLFFSLFIWSVYLIVPMSPRSPHSPRSPRSPYSPQSSHLYNFTVPEIFI